MVGCIVEQDQIQICLLSVEFSEEFRKTDFIADADTDTEGIYLYDPGVRTFCEMIPVPTPQSTLAVDLSFSIWSKTEGCVKELVVLPENRPDDEEHITIHRQFLQALMNLIYL